MVFNETGHNEKKKARDTEVLVEDLGTVMLARETSAGLEGYISTDCGRQMMTSSVLQLTTYMALCRILCITTCARLVDLVVWRE